MEVGINTGGDMSMLSLAAMPAGIQARSIDNSFKIIVLLCSVGLVASFSLMARGIDLSAGLM